MFDQIDDNTLMTTAIESRLARLEDQIRDLHDWMRSEQVSSLPNAYRRLYSRLTANDFERRFAANVTRSIFQARGGRDASDEELDRLAIEEINGTIDPVEEALPRIRKRDSGERPYVVALVGSSGSGKTTMMYKLAVRGVLNHHLRVKIVSCDTYKIGSVEGVQTIADILNVPVGIAFDGPEVAQQIDESDADLVIIDTAGRADRSARAELESFMETAEPDEIQLVLSSTMSARSIQDTAALFLGERINSVTFTKLDEASSLGAMVSSLNWIDLPLSYLSTGTVIPDDLVPATSANIGEWAILGLPVPEHGPEASHV